MDTKKLFRMASQLNSFIIVADIYCQYYEDQEIMFDFAILMSYIKNLSDDLYFEISQNTPYDN